MRSFTVNIVFQLCGSSVLAIPPREALGDSGPEPLLRNWREACGEDGRKWWRFWRYVPASQRQVVPRPRRQIDNRLAGIAVPVA
jgi:hypothetical protein